MIYIAINFAIAVLVSSCCLYVAARLIAYQGQLIDFFYVVLAGSIMTLVPTIGWLLSFIIVVYLIIKLLDTSIVDAIWVASVAGMLRALVLLGLN